MSGLSVTDKTFLEAVLSMGGGYILDFKNTSFAQFFDDLGIDIYEEKYAEYGVSKANRLKTFWKLGSGTEIASSLRALADYAAARKVTGGCQEVTEEQIAKIRDIAETSAGGSSTAATGAPIAITTEATVTKNLISIEIHEDIYGHIQQYLATGDYFHSVRSPTRLFARSSVSEK